MSTPAQRRAQRVPAPYKPVEARMAGAEGRARGGSAPGGGSHPALGEWGQQGGRGAGASGSAAARRRGDHAWPHPPYRYAQSPTLSTPHPLPNSGATGKAPENILSLLPTLQPPPAPGAAAPAGREEVAEAGRRNPRRRAGNEAGRPPCAQQVCACEAATPCSAEPGCTYRRSGVETWIPCDHPAPALQSPRPHAAPRARGSGGQQRPPGRGPRPSSRPPAAHEPAREAAPISWHLPAPGPLPTSPG